MKKFVSAVTLLALTLVGSAIPAAADPETSQYQYSSLDKSTPIGMSPFFDIKSLASGLDDNGEMTVWVDLMTVPQAAEYGSKSAKIKIEFDTNLDGVADYYSDSQGKWNRNWLSNAQLFSSKGLVVEDCAPSVGSGESYPYDGKEGFMSWTLPKSCLGKLSARIGVKVSATSDEISFDYFPEGASWWQPKTDFLAVAPCNSSQANSKVTYMHVTYACIKTSGKWSWKDYGPIAAKNAKYATEKALYACRIVGKTGVELGDRGKTLSLVTAQKYEDASDVSEANFACVKKYVAMPNWVTTMVEQTRSVDGMVKASWGKINAFWTYHPDSGLVITFNSR